VLSSTSDTAASNLSIFFEFIKDNLPLKSILEELTKDLPDFESIRNEMNSRRRLAFPQSYLDKIKVCLSALLYIIEKNEEPWRLTFNVNPVSNTDVGTRFALQQFFEPFYEYIDEKVDGMDLLLFLLARFKLKTEWFDKSLLFDTYKADTKKGEESLDAALRSYLYDQGLSFPFSSPLSPSGRVDILSLVEHQPIPLEVKVFDAEGRG